MQSKNFGLQKWRFQTLVFKANESFEAKFIVHLLRSTCMVSRVTCAVKTGQILFWLYESLGFVSWWEELTENPHIIKTLDRLWNLFHQFNRIASKTLQCSSRGELCCMELFTFFHFWFIFWILPLRVFPAAVHDNIQFV